MPRYKTLCDPYECYFCGLRTDPDIKGNYRNIIEIHHITERNEGGTNEKSNLIAVCSNHHSMIHEEKIKVIGWNFSTCGWLLHWYDNDGSEHWGKP